MSRRMTWVLTATFVLALSAAWPNAARAQSPAFLPAHLAGAADAQPAEKPVKKPHGFLHKLLFYLPNRVLDVTDIFSAGVMVPTVPKNFFAGFVHVNAHATRAIQLGAGYTNENIAVGKGYKRRFLPRFTEQYELSAGPVTICKHVVSGGNDSVDFKKVGMLLPTDEPFAKGRMDYWGVGAEATALIVGVKAEVHPVEVFDAVLGFLFLDLAGDDL